MVHKLHAPAHVYNICLGNYDCSLNAMQVKCHTRCAFLYTEINHFNIVKLRIAQQTTILLQDCKQLAIFQNNFRKQAYIIVPPPS